MKLDRPLQIYYSKTQREWFPFHIPPYRSLSRMCLRFYFQKASFGDTSSILDTPLQEHFPHLLNTVRKMMQRERGKI